MATNRPGYMKQYKMELRTTIAFLATDGEMITSTGEPVIICNLNEKGPQCTTYHHRLHLNGNRPNGTLARLREMMENYWNIEIMTMEAHKQLHIHNKDFYFKKSKVKMEG